jgi:HK97 family phage major capsid protein
MSELITMKKTLDELSGAFAEFKKANDEKIAALKLSKSTAELDEKLAKLTSKMDDEEKKHDALIKAAEEKEKKREKEMEKLEADIRREFEAKLGRAANPLGGNAEEEQLKAKRKLERKAFNTMLRSGDDRTSRLTEDERKALVISNDTTGGYLAPPEYIAEIIKAVVLISPMRGIVGVRNIGTQSLKQPKRTATASASRVGETGSRTETTNPAYGLVEIPAPEMFAEAHISMQNLEDSAFDLEAELTEEFTTQFAVLEGNEIINGNGVGKCLGILDANAAGKGTPLTYTPSGSAATIAGPSGSQGDGLITMLHALKTAYAVNARWLMNRASLGAVRGLKDTQGRYLWEPALVPGNPSMILGLPYTEAPDMPSQGANAFPIALGDWKRGYLIAQRLEMAMVRDPYSLANVGQVKFVARRRMGGQVVLGEALSLLKCSVS